MEKLQLKDGEQIEILNGASENCVMVEVVSVDIFKEIYEKFTDDNLSEIRILNDADMLCAIYKNRTLSKAELETVMDEETEESKLIAMFNLKSIDSTKQELKSLRETVNALVLANLEVE
ncbi:MAG: hypothetical protein H2184_08780 [Candidatus Galacturonibacter soehngenii]|nr:hypothetical protein [Candidatus Galacturonibacter soehngenii]